MLLVVALIGNALLIGMVPQVFLLETGVWTAAVGLLLGVPTGFWYHVALGQTLSTVRRLPPLWWLRPVPLNAWLDASGRRRVMPWFYAGAVGFVMTVSGLVLIAIGIWRSLL